MSHSHCVLGNRKFQLKNERIFFGLPGFTTGFAIGEFIGKISTSYGYIATVVLLITSISSVLCVILSKRKSLDLRWFIFILLVGNIASSSVYLTIITQSEGPIIKEDKLPMNGISLNGTYGTDDGGIIVTEMGNVSTTESPTNQTNETHHQNMDKVSHTNGLKSPIAFIVLGVFLLFNSIASYWIKIAADEPTADVVECPVNNSEMEAFKQKKNETDEDSETVRDDQVL